MTVTKADDLNRTALIGARDGTAPTIEDAVNTHNTTAITLVADPALSLSVPGQAALCTAITTAVRAFGTVTVIANGRATLTAGPYQGRNVSDMITAEGAHLSTGAAVVDGPILLIGSAAPPDLRGTAERGRVVLRAIWTGWTARVVPAQTDDSPDRRRDGKGNVLAAIAAAAMGTHEAFGATHARPGSDAGYRTMQLNLWRPGSDVDDGPPLSHAPAAWWLVGLGHLGQAFAWVISWLTYADQSSISVVLQDTDTAIHANHSTGLFTPPHPAPCRKTRLAAAVLDTIGFNTALIERELDRHSRITDADYHVALIGVDNIPTRRLISNVGWPLAIDVGLGAGPADYNAMLLHRFPGARPSNQIAGWAGIQPATPAVPDLPAFRDLAQRDPCGVVTAAGTAVGAAFVGVTAACLAVAEAVRDVLGGTGHDVINLHLQSADLDFAVTDRTPDIIPARLVT